MVLGFITSRLLSHTPRPKTLLSRLFMMMMMMMCVDASVGKRLTSYIAPQEPFTWDLGINIRLGPLVSQ